MLQSNLDDVKNAALKAKQRLQLSAQEKDRAVTLYLHWSAGHYGQFFPEYHINIDKNGEVYLTEEDLSVVKAHTWRRNSGAIGITLACCYGAKTNDLGEEPPTSLQIEAMAQVVAVLAEALEITIDDKRVMTHAEAADLDGYGPATSCERWDLWFLPGEADKSGGDILRGKALWYQASAQLSRKN